MHLAGNRSSTIANLEAGDGLSVMEEGQGKHTLYSRFKYGATRHLHANYKCNYIIMQLYLWNEVLKQSMICRSDSRLSYQYL